MTIKDADRGQEIDVNQLNDNYKYHFRVGGFSSPNPRIFLNVTANEIRRQYNPNEDCYIGRVKRR